MGMSRTSLSRHLIKFLKDEEDMVLKATDDLDREDVMRMYHKSKITVEDMQREYSPEDVRMLCERTKVRVKMYELNTVWDAKKRFDRKKRLENKSESYVNRMFVKAHKRRMVQPYSDLEIERYKELAACQTKKDNNARLDRWHRQALRASRSNHSEVALEILISSGSEPEYEAEMLTVAQKENIPPVFVEPTLAPLESQPLSESDDGTMDDLLEPPPAPLQSQPQSESDDGTMDDLLEPPPAPLQSQPQSQSDESTMDDLFQVVKQPPAQEAMPNPDSEPNLWGIGDDQEVDVEEATGGPPAPHEEVAELNSFDWQQLGNRINSESLSVGGINTNTLNTEPDYDCFGTQVVAASTQDTVESQQFF